MKQKSTDKEDMMNIPNSITVLRLIIAVVSFVLMLTDRWMSSFILILIAVLLDIVDGRVARRLRQVTKYGIFFDIMADKIVIIATFLVIGVKIEMMFFYLGILMLIREYIIDTLRAIAASERKVITSDRFSKIKGILFMAAMLMMIANHTFNHTASAVVVDNIAIIIATIGIIFSYITLARFIRSYKEMIKR